MAFLCGNCCDRFGGREKVRVAGGHRRLEIREGKHFLQASAGDLVNAWLQPMQAVTVGIGSCLEQGTERQVCATGLHSGRNGEGDPRAAKRSQEVSSFVRGGRLCWSVLHRPDGFRGEADGRPP